MTGLEATLEACLARRAAAQRLRCLTTVPADAVDFSSNDYLSLSHDAGLQRAFVRRLEGRLASPGGRFFGSGGSRLLDGNSAFAEALEARVAAFHGAPAALLFTSAYDANAGLLACAPQPGDVVLFDEAVHASVHDGLRLSRAGLCRAFAHASVVAGGPGGEDDDDDDEDNDDDDDDDDDGPPGLAELLEQVKAEDEAVGAGARNVFVCVEAVYSMDGRALDLAAVVAAVDAALPRGNGHIVLDEVHATGVLGRQGRGLACAAGLEGRVWARVLGFGKAMGCAGGAVLCSPTARAYLINYARPLIYTTAMAFPSLLSIDLAYAHLASGAADAARLHLRQLVVRAHGRLAAVCERLLLLLPPPFLLEPQGREDDAAGKRGRRRKRKILRVEPHPPPSPILPVYAAAPRALAAFCQRRGLVVRPIVAPTVRKGTERVRVCLHAANTPAEVDALARAVEDWAREQLAAGDADPRRRVPDGGGAGVMAKGARL